jgi:hypothetical protein
VRATEAEDYVSSGTSRDNSPFIIGSTSDPGQPKHLAASCDGGDSERSQVAGRSAGGTNVELLSAVDLQPLPGSAASAGLKLSDWPLPVAPRRICSPNREPSSSLSQFCAARTGVPAVTASEKTFCRNSQAGYNPGDRIHALRGGAVGVLSRGSVVCPGRQPFDVCTPGPRDVLFPLWSILSHHLLP